MGAPTEINPRKALAGLHMLSGSSQAAALRAAGYTPTTAVNPGQNGLMVKHCVSEAAKLDPSLSPAVILSKVRRVLVDRLNDGSAMRDANLSTVVRMVDVAERHYGSSDPDSAASARSFHDRLEWLRELARLETASAAPHSPDHDKG